MPLQQILPTWSAINNANSLSQSGISDSNGQAVNAGGLNIGDYFDLTNDEAASASYTTNGILFAGRYRWVNVDSGATAANVKTGTVGYLANGSTVKTAAITSLGSGQTPGTYQVAANIGSGSGSGAILGVVVGASGTITNVYVISGGFGYNSVPVFTVAAGGTPGTVVGQLNATPNRVTSFDQVAIGTGIAVRAIVFLNSVTPGSYGFIQELGTATVLGNATIGAGNSPGGFVNVAAAGSGTVNTTAASGSPLGSTIGVAIDTPLASNLFKIQLQYVPVIQD